MVAPPVIVSRIDVRVIEHKDQRYETVGDWTTYDEEPGKRALLIWVSRTKDWRVHMLVAVHEIVEALLCLHKGVTAQQVDAFDEAFEAARRNSVRGEQFPFRTLMYDHDAEPGDSPDAPYHNQHCFATAVERMLCPVLGMSWAYYELVLGSLPERNTP